MPDLTCVECSRRFYCKAGNAKRCSGCRRALGAARPPGSAVNGPRLCDWCGAVFLPRMAHQRFHSGDCRLRWKRATHDELYGRTHKAAKSSVARLVNAGGAVCARCGLPIAPGEPWDLGHVDGDPSRYAGPEHRRCNRAAPNYRRRVNRASAQMGTPAARFSREW